MVAPKPLSRKIRYRSGEKSTTLHLKKELPLAHANYQTYLGYLPESVLLTSIHLVCANVGRSSGLGFKWIAQKILLAPELNPHNPPSLYHRTGPP